MRKRILIAGAVLTLTALALAMARSSRSAVRPPVLSLVIVEPSLIFDDAGVEMRLLTLSISNTSSARDVSGDVWVRVLSPWSSGGTTKPPLRLEPQNAYRVPPGKQGLEQFLVPAQASSMGIKIEYSAGFVPLKARLCMMAQSAPMAIRRRLVYIFWRWGWAGFPYSEPGTDWHELSAELPIRITPAQ